MPRTATSKPTPGALVRIVALFPQSLAAEVDKLTDDARREDPGVNRSVIIRKLVRQALAASRTTKGIRAVG